MTPRRQEIIGEVVSPKPANQVDCLLKCPDCRGWIDITDLAAVLEHESPLGQDQAE